MQRLHTNGGEKMHGIKTQRHKKGMNQKDLAAAIGVDRSTITKWENGTSYPRAWMLPKIADVLGCTVDDLLRETA